MTGAQIQELIEIVREMLTEMYVNPAFTNDRIGGYLARLEALEEELKGKG